MALEKFRLGLEEALDDTLHELARLVLELSLGWAEDLLKDADELGSLVDGCVLLKVLLQGQEADENGQDVRDRNAVGVGDDHAAHTASSVVLNPRVVDGQHGLQLGQDVGVARQAALLFVSGSTSVRRLSRSLRIAGVYGETAAPMCAEHSARTPTAVERSRFSWEEANFITGFSKIFHSSPNWEPMAAANPMMTSSAVSTTTQSYSDEPPSTSCSSSSPKSCWQGCERVTMVLQGGRGNNLAQLDQGLGGHLRGREARLPFGAGLLLEELEDASAACVRDDISKDFDSDLLLHGFGSDSVICPVIIVLLFEIVVIHGLLALSCRLLAAVVTKDGLLLLRKIEYKTFLLLLQAVEQTLEDTDDEGGKVLAVHLRQGTPQDEACLAESWVAQIQSLLTGLHEIHNIGLELLRTDSRGDTAHGVTDTTAEVQLVFAVLDLDEGTQGGHGVFEVRGKALLHGTSNSTQSTSSGTLDLEVGMSQEVANGSNELRSVLLHDSRVETGCKSIQRCASTAHDFNILLRDPSIRRGDTSSLDVVENRLDERITVVGKLLCHLIGDTSQTDEGGVTDTGVGIVEQADDDGHDHLELGRDKVWRTLRHGAQCKDASLPEASVGRGGKCGQGIEQRHDDLSGGQVARELSSAGGGDVVLILIIINLSEDLHALKSQLGAHVLHGLDLHAAIAHSLGQEGKSLAANLVVGVLVGSKIASHEGHQVPKVGTEKDRLVGEELLEDLKGLLGSLVIIVLDSILQDVDHGRNEVLDSSDDGIVLLGLDQHQHGANGHHGVDANVSALRILDGIGKEGEQLADLVGERSGIFLQDGVNDVGADLAVGNFGGVACEGEEGGDQLWPGVVISIEVETCNAGDNARLGVPGPGVLLLHCSLDKVLTDASLLVCGYFLPVFGHKSGSLNSGLLTEVDIVICADDLDKEEQRLRLGVEVLLELCRDGLDPLGISCSWEKQQKSAKSPTTR
ncbi:hypothetical protein VSDG_07545 [Cytospora chrysosperma]|uniref:Uncharacterized protein n=1 Tax=Cytospora chrysosperma TaxID=252740 RepID=A0A423VM72_CYTCH|nr:hypothetical protein VSDG_07545 [Valsa sordida]